MAYTLEDYVHQPASKVPHSWTVHQGKPFKHLPQPLASLRVLDIGCGNGYWADQLQQRGAKVVGVDASTAGIQQAKAEYPNGHFVQIPFTEDICAAIQQPPFDAAIAIEVVEHVYDPRSFARTCFNALRPGGTVILTTPYHGYLKNLALAVTGKMDQHFTALWDGGHIKFWSCKTLRCLLEEAGFVDVRFDFSGRAPYLWMSMIAVARKPGAGE
jgi:2-polyprenyl-6-hydroxyphenyl methylase/3-demethylubiquinone-9 3-methyltransferase